MPTPQLTTAATAFAFKLDFNVSENIFVFDWLRTAFWATDTVDLPTVELMVLAE